MKSIIDNNKCCFICKTPYNIHLHHIFFGANRKKSDKDGCWVYLCARHHNMSDEGVHFNRELDLKLKRLAEKRWCEYYDKTTNDFIKRYYKNYL